MSSRRKIANARDARLSLAALDRSGETLRVWSRRNGVDGRSLRAWQINLARSRGNAAPAAGLVELVPTPAAASSSARYVVRIADVAIELGDDFDAGTLCRLVATLRAC